MAQQYQASSSVHPLQLSSPQRPPARAAFALPDPQTVRALTYGQPQAGHPLGLPGGPYQPSAPHAAGAGQGATDVYDPPAGGQMAVVQYAYVQVHIPCLVYFISTAMCVTMATCDCVGLSVS